MGSFEIVHVARPADRIAELATDVRRGLAADPKWLPSKWFYDDRGSALFEQITELPEYYLTRAETEILRRCADSIMDAGRPEELVELGSGSSTKTRLLIEAMGRDTTGRRYVAIDVSDGALKDAGAALAADYPWLTVEGVVADFDRDLGRIPHHGRRMVIFLGSTIGNLNATARRRFFGNVRAVLENGDSFLLGVDLLKDEPVMIAAYDDSAGVSAEFNRNILRVVNRLLDGNLPVDAFAHRTRFDPETGCMRQSLVATRAVTARLAAIDLEVRFDGGEELHTEISCKFTRASLEEELGDAGLHIHRWWTDPGDRFALALIVPAGGALRAAP